MILLGKWQGKPVNISVKPSCLTVSVEGAVGTDVFSYDGEGRLWTAFLDGISYRRGLDGKMVAKWRLPGNARDRRWLPRDEALAVEMRARSTIESLLRGLQAGDADLNSPLTPDANAFFQAVVCFDAWRSQADAAHYADIYKPVGILPPDQYMAVVLQLTEGCSFNTCTFCDFYKGRPFRIKPVDEFRSHARAVKEYLGAGLSLRRTIFLGDANALVVPQARLMPLIDAVHEIYDVGALGGLYAFLDGFSGDKKTIKDYRQLGARGLSRVYIGMESGSADLLRFLKKPGKPSDVIQAARSMKDAGVALGVIVLLGAGGHQYADRHVRDTIQALNSIPFGEDDIIYFSQLFAGEDLPYARDAAQAGIQSMSTAECEAQGDQIEAGLRFSAGSSPRISRYDIREFIY